MSLFKSLAGRKEDSGVWQYFSYSEGKNISQYEIVDANSGACCNKQLAGRPQQTERNTCVERIFSVAGWMSTGRRNRLRKSLEMRVFLKLNSKIIDW